MEISCVMDRCSCDMQNVWILLQISFWTINCFTNCIYTNAKLTEINSMSRSIALMTTWHLHYLKCFTCVRMPNVLVLSSGIAILIPTVENFAENACKNCNGGITHEEDVVLTSKRKMKVGTLSMMLLHFSVFSYVTQNCKYQIRHFHAYSNLQYKVSRWRMLLECSLYLQGHSYLHSNFKPKSRHE